jgi:trichothecene 3-O-acetyltransferase
MSEDCRVHRLNVTSSYLPIISVYLTGAAVLPLPDQSRMRSQLDALIPRYTQGHFHVESYVNGKFEYMKTLSPGPETPRSQRLFVIPAPLIRKFRKDLEGLSGFSISICNIITALVWIHVTRARASRLQQPKFKYDNTSIGISVNLRNRMMPPLQDDYTGNMALYAKATLPIADLITEQRYVI